MIEITEARKIIDHYCVPLPAEVTPLTSAALGLVLAEDITADHSSPPFAKALMDGFAVNFSTESRTLTVKGEIMAGQETSAVLSPGQAFRIATGAQVPENTSVVIPWEECVVTEDQVSVPDRVFAAQENVLPAGAEFETGEKVLEAGTTLTPAHFGLLATVGKTAVRAIPAPRLTILVTGDEVVEANMMLKPGKIRNSNGPMLVAAAVQAGGLPRYLGIGRDDRSLLTSLIKEGLTTSNIVLITGGTSTGKLDLVPEVLRELGVNLHFHGVRVKPGKPILFGSKDHVLVYGLPGNPCAAFVGFELLVRPALAQLAGRAVEPRVREYPLGEPVTGEFDRPTFFPVKLVLQENQLQVKLSGWFGSADLRSLAASQGLMPVPAGSISWKQGDTVSVRELG